MVSTVAMNQSENPCYCYHRRLPFPFDAELNIMNTFGWARGRDCRLVRFSRLALARGGQASHSLVKTPAKIMGKLSGGTLGGIGS
jgi:hypothetical protein